VTAADYSMLDLPFGGENPLHLLFAEPLTLMVLEVGIVGMRPICNLKTLTLVIGLKVVFD